MSLKLNVSIVMFLSVIFLQADIFRTSVYPGRIFISSEGGIENIEVFNSSSENVTILLSTDEEIKEYIKFYPRAFELKPRLKQIVRVDVKGALTSKKKSDKIIYVTEIKPLAIVNGQKIMPRHGITILEKKNSN